MTGSAAHVGASHFWVHAVSGSQTSEQPLISQLAGAGSHSVWHRGGAQVTTPFSRTQSAGSQTVRHDGAGARQWTTGGCPPSTGGSDGASQCVTQCGILQFVSQGKQGEVVHTGHLISHSGFSHLVRHVAAG